MSDEAIPERSITPMTAVKCRQLFVERGVKFEKFYCPESSCGVRVYAVIIYKDEIKNSRTPCFRASKKNPHPPSCPYYKESTKTPHSLSNRHFEKDAIETPAALIEPRKYSKRANKTKIDTGIQVTNTAPLGNAKCRVSQIKDIVIVWRETKEKIFSDKINNQMSYKDKWSLFHEEMSKLPLMLYTFNTTFKTAFSDTYFTPTTYPRIFWGTANIFRQSDGFSLFVDKEVHQENDVIKKVEIIIPLACFDDFQFKWQTQKYDFLTKNHLENQSIEWFAYGCLVENTDIYTLTVDNARHLHFFNPKQ